MYALNHPLQNLNVHPVDGDNGLDGAPTELFLLYYLAFLLYY
jgi:hypothetical protein